MITLSFELNDGTVDFITFSKDFLDNLDDSEFFEIAEEYFRKEYNDDTISVIRCRGIVSDYLVDFEF